MNQLNDSDYAALKALHLAVRTELRAAHKVGGDRHRYAILASAFVRGRLYRQHERSHRRQKDKAGLMFEHNMPCAFDLARTLAPFMPEIGADLGTYCFKPVALSRARLEAWLADPRGAIALIPRAKKHYTVPRDIAVEHASVVAAE